jgi:hypothetical protein
MTIYVIFDPINEIILCAFRKKVDADLYCVGYRATGETAYVIETKLVN